MRKIAVTIGALLLLTAPAAAYIEGPVYVDANGNLYAVGYVSINNVTYAPSGKVSDPADAPSNPRQTCDTDLECRVMGIERAD